MQEEIKEILNKLLEYFKESNINDFGYEKDKLISYEEAQILLNYITNLQEENEYSNHCNEELRKKITNLEYKIERLEEDNKQLKELCDKYEEEHKTTFEEWKKDIKANKKAIEYIKENGCFNEEYKLCTKPFNTLKLDDLLNLLQGSDKE